MSSRSIVDLPNRLRQIQPANRARDDALHSDYPRGKRRGLRRAAARSKHSQCNRRHRQREFSFSGKSAACAVNQSKVRLDEAFEEICFEVGAFAEDWFELEATFFPDFVFEATITALEGVLFWSATSID